MKSGYAVDWQVGTHDVSSCPHCSIKPAPGSQDLVSRFTLDSATEFLFGRDVHSLSAGLPYPPESELARLQTTTPEADEFASAFLWAQTASAKRGRYQGLWALQEFWTDKVQSRKAAIDKFINPILLDAIQKKNENEKGQGDDGKVSEEDTLLSQLLKVTDGMSHSLLVLAERWQMLMLKPDRLQHHPR